MVSGNLFTALKAHLKGTPCRALTESVKVQRANDALLYPDVFVTCDPQDLKTERVFRSPSLIVEVLSDSTQACDRGLKFKAYRQTGAGQRGIEAADGRGVRRALRRHGLKRCGPKAKRLGLATITP